MISQIQLFQQWWQVNLQQPLDISIPIGHPSKSVKAWYVNNPEFLPVKGDGFIGAVALGGSVNFRDVTFNPHGHGTHTECVGHITPEVFSVNQHIQQYFFASQLISVEPENINDDFVITPAQLKSANIHKDTKAIIIRTLPNTEQKLNTNYSSTNPPYLHPEAMKYIVSCNIEHLLIDLPSVDREVDGGELKAHHIFWNTKGNIRFNCSITELIFVPNHILDGLYLLNLQFAPLHNDASPSRPVLFELNKP